MRSKSLEFQTDILDLEVEVTCTVTAGYPGRGPSMMHSGGEPSDPPEVEDLYVGIIVNGTAIDVTDKLPEKVRNRIMDECLERAGDDER